VKFYFKKYVVCATNQKLGTEDFVGSVNFVDNFYLLMNPEIKLFIFIFI